MNHTLSTLCNACPDQHHPLCYTGNEYVMQETKSNGLGGRILFNSNVHAHGYCTEAPYDVLLWKAHHQYMTAAKAVLYIINTNM